MSSNITGEFQRLWKSYGFKKYKMRKFEEYSLYLQNKNFLQSEYVITFNDLSGKLLALKPDVTLSILKNKSSDGDNQKLYYTESVYRLDKKAHSYKEIDQAGLEVIGSVGITETVEVISLALKSLALTGRGYTLDISHMGLLTSLVKEATEGDAELEREVLSFISMKNSHDLKKALGEKAEKLLRLVSLPRDTDSALKELSEIFGENKELSELIRVISVLKELGLGGVSLDFSIINDTEYYNGIVFRGYAKGAPRQVLSGGRYDRLADKFKKGQEALGFAIYLGELPAEKETNSFDCDVLIISSNPVSSVTLAETLRKTGKSVRIERTRPENIRAKEVLEVE